MQAVDVVIETPISTSIRARQVSAMFDVPAQEKCRLEWHLSLGLDERPWNVGLIVGPSGSGKSTIMRKLWGSPRQLTWPNASVVDDFDKALSIQDITSACSAVGFNTIPAWLRPFDVLSNGEKFRVEMARLLVEETKGPVVVDEFTSLVDRQVGRVASHAVQKYARKQKRQFVAVTCHYDVEDWLQPDWIVDMADRSFRWRELQRRPPIECEIRRVPYSTWGLFAPFHYLTNELHRGAHCWALFVNSRPVSFAAVLHFPHPKVRDIKRISRTVTLPDWQGLGLVFVLTNALGAAFKTMGCRLRAYPAHPAQIRARQASPQWKMVSPPGFSNLSSRAGGKSTLEGESIFGARPCATFEYVGERMEESNAFKLLT